MRRFWLFAALLCACAAQRPAYEVCTIDGGAANTPLTLTAEFGLTGCASSAECTASVDGGVIVLETTGFLCSTGCNPGGSLVSAPCQLPPLAPGTYVIAPFNETLVVVADGGATSCP